MQSSGRVREVWRYPVKSMAGERLDAAEIGAGGLDGDRHWAVRDEEKQVIAGAKRMPALLRCAARYVDGGRQVAITLEDGAELRSDDPGVHRRLSEALGRQVTLCEVRPASDVEFYKAPQTTAAEMREHFALEPGEPLPDFSMLPASLLAELYRYATPRGTFFDAYVLHVVTTASLAAIRAVAPGSDVDARRFRPNLVVDTGDDGGLVENDWCGGVLHAGALLARIQVPTVRCAMPTRAQPGLPADPAVLKAISKHASRCLGVYATVDRPGRVAVGDPVAIEPPETGVVGKWMKAGATSLKRLALRGAATTLPDD